MKIHFLSKITIYFGKRISKTEVEVLAARILSKSDCLFNTLAVAYHLQPHVFCCENVLVTLAVFSNHSFHANLLKTPIIEVSYHLHCFSL